MGFFKSKSGTPFLDSLDRAERIKRILTLPNLLMIISVAFSVYVIGRARGWW